MRFCQIALSTRAGTDCVGHAVGANTGTLSIDDVGAYDHSLEDPQRAERLLVLVSRWEDDADSSQLAL